MANAIKPLSRLLLLIILVFGLSLQASVVSGIPKPSVPEFTVKYVDHSYDVPTTYSTDRFTGENITHHGYHVKNRTIEVTIKNQPFTSTKIDGNNSQLFYVVRWKGHFEDWADSDKFGISVVGFNFDFDYYLENYGVEVSNSEYTVKTYTLGSFGNVPANGQIDFQVKAQVGYSYAYFGNHAHIQPIGINFKVVEESDWSSTQTLSLAENTVIPEFPSWTILPLVLTVTLLLMFIKRNLHKAKAS